MPNFTQREYDRLVEAHGKDMVVIGKDDWLFLKSLLSANQVAALADRGVLTSTLELEG